MRTLPCFSPPTCLDHLKCAYVQQTARAEASEMDSHLHTCLGAVWYASTSKLMPVMTSMDSSWGVGQATWQGKYAETCSWTAARVASRLHAPSSKLPARSMMVQHTLFGSIQLLTRMLRGFRSKKQRLQSCSAFMPCTSVNTCQC